MQLESPPPSKAEQIRRLHADNKKASEIAKTVGVNRSYVYQIIGHKAERWRQRDVQDQILREVRELRSEIRLLMGQKRHPVARLLT